MTNKEERSYSHWDSIVSTVSEFPLRQKYILLKLKVYFFDSFLTVPWKSKVLLKTTRKIMETQHHFPICDKEYKYSGIIFCRNLTKLHKLHFEI